MCQLATTLIISYVLKKIKLNKILQMTIETTTTTIATK